MHVSATLTCNEARKEEFNHGGQKKTRNSPLKTQDENTSTDWWDLSNNPDDDAMDTIADSFHYRSTPADPPNTIGENMSPSRPKNNEPDVDVRSLHFSEQYPHSIATPLGFQKTRFENDQ